MGHEYALEAEECAQAGNLRRAEQLERLASSSYLRAMEAVRQEDRKTRAALKLIADNHEQRAMRWHRTLTLNQSPHANPSGAFGPSHIVATSATPTSSERHGSFDLTPPPNAPNTASTTTTRADDDYSLPLRNAASEMEELFERLKELGVRPPPSRGHPSQTHYAQNHSHQNGPQQHLMKQHLSSDLGDSFCLLPKSSLGKTSSSSLAAHRVDGGATLKAAAAHRMKNQREMLMEKQGSRRSGSIPPDHGPPTPEKAATTASPAPAERASMSDAPMDGEMEQLRTALAHQKFEANRLMHTIKTLGSENAKLIQDTETMARLREENKRLVHAMDEFKTEYHQKFAVLKRALEEWWRQEASHQSQRSHDTSRQSMEAMEGKMEADLQILRDELAAEQEASRQKDIQLQRYETWFKSLKASAKAKQQSRESNASDGGRSSLTSSFEVSQMPATSTRREL